MIEIALIFVVAGAVKGVAGMGLPTISMGLLGLFMAPAEAAALVIVPSLITNVWQFTAAPGRSGLLRRVWPMLLAMSVVTVAAAGLLASPHAERAVIALGLVLMIYGAVGLAKIHPRVPRRLEAWLGPFVGAITGLVTGATGVFVIPAGPYFQAIGLEKDDLIGVLGLSFTVSTLALAAGLAGRGAYQIAAVGASVLCAVPALAGVLLGQWVRGKIDQMTFRRVFFFGLVLLGADLLARAVF